MAGTSARTLDKDRQFRLRGFVPCHSNDVQACPMQRFTNYGVLKPDESGAPKVKIYKDRATQMPKGDGLVTFLYEPSVNSTCLC